MAEYLRIVVDNQASAGAGGDAVVGEPPKLSPSQLAKFGFAAEPETRAALTVVSYRSDDGFTSAVTPGLFATPPGMGASGQLLVAVAMQAAAASALMWQGPMAPAPDTGEAGAGAAAGGNLPMPQTMPLAPPTSFLPALAESGQTPATDGAGPAGHSVQDAVPPGSVTAAGDGSTPSLAPHDGFTEAPRHVPGSSTSESLITLKAAAADAADEPAAVVEATAGSDVLVATPGVATTFVFTGAAGPDNFDSYTGNAETRDTVDLSHLGDLAQANAGPVIAAPPAQGGAAPEPHGEAPEAIVPALNGVYVDLGADTHSVETPDGQVTVQAWQLDADGRAATPLAHLDSIEAVVGTIGNDIIVGDEHANVFVYTAADDAMVDAAGNMASGAHAVYGFDIYDGGDGPSPFAPAHAAGADHVGNAASEPAVGAGSPPPTAETPFADGLAAAVVPAGGSAGASDHVGDLAAVVAPAEVAPPATTTADTAMADMDIVDFARLAVAGPASPDDTGGGADVDSMLLPDHALGIQVDLAAAVEVTVTNPETGDPVTITGSLVTTVGGDSDQALALLTWTGQDDGDGHSTDCSTIEGISGSQGSDVLLGDDQQNLFIYNSDGEHGASYYDGREGQDTASFENYVGDGGDGGECGITVDLSDTSQTVVDASGTERVDVVAVWSSDDAESTVLAYLQAIENIVGTRKNDTLSSSSADNYFVGGEGADRFVFREAKQCDGMGPVDIGHDVIADFSHAEQDVVTLSDEFFGFDSDTPLEHKIAVLLKHVSEDQDGNLVITFDENNSIKLVGYDLEQALQPQSDDKALTAAIYSDFRFI